MSKALAQSRGGGDNGDNSSEGEAAQIYGAFQTPSVSPARPRAARPAPPPPPLGHTPGASASSFGGACIADADDGDDEECAKQESNKKLMRGVDFQSARFRKIKQDSLAEPADRDAAPAPLAELL